MESATLIIYLKQNATNLWHGIIFTAIIFGFLYLAKIINDIRTKEIDDDYEIEENSNNAIGFRRAGLYLGMAIAMIGAFSGRSAGFLNDLTALVGDGFLTLVCFFIARYITDWITLRGINNDHEALKGNSAVGLVELGNYLGTGLILNGAFSGEGGGFVSSLVFFGLGQLALVVIFMIYEGITSFNVVEEIRKGNNAAGLAAAGMMTALGIILRASIAGNFVSWSQDIMSFGISAVSGIALLLIFRSLIDKIFLPNTTLAGGVKRHNVSALVVTQGVLLSLAFVLSAVIV